MTDASKDPAPPGTEPEPSPKEGDEPPVVKPSEPEAASAPPASTEPAAPEPDKANAEGAEEDVPLDAAGRERPKFLLGFPNDPDLARLAAAFEAGNYALVRAEAEALAERAKSPAVRDAALELRRRIEPDPLAKYMLALTAALLLLLAYWAYHH